MYNEQALIKWFRKGFAEDLKKARSEFRLGHSKVTENYRHSLSNFDFIKNGRHVHYKKVGFSWNDLKNNVDTIKPFTDKSYGELIVVFDICEHNEKYFDNEAELPNLLPMVEAVQYYIKFYTLKEVERVYKARLAWLIRDVKYKLEFHPNSDVAKQYLEVMGSENVKVN